MLRALAPGEKFETDGLLLGMSDAPLVWSCTSRDLSSEQFMFSLSYLGVGLGQMALFIRKTGVVDAEAL